MTISQIYNLAIKLGIEADPRGKFAVLRQLKREKNNYDELGKDAKAEFDKEKLTNPYADTRILFGNLDKPVKRVLVGIDIDTSELLIADRFNQSRKKIDLVISHHPAGRALFGIDDVVLKMQAEMLVDHGIPFSVSEAHIEERATQLTRTLSPGNFYRVVDNAQVLGIPLMCTHTTADNLAYQFVKRQVEKTKPETLRELVKSLKTIDEYKIATSGGGGPRIFHGNAQRRCGKISFSELAGGTNGSKNIYDKLTHVGYSTIVSMHMSEEYFEEAKKAHINVVVAGHISSDSLGMNQFLDQLESAGIQVIPCAGLIRVKRSKK